MRRSAGQASHRIVDIELLRAVAVVMVLVEHVPLNLVTWPNSPMDYMLAYCRTWTGVDLFFAVSGFVIGRTVLPLVHTAPDHPAYLRATLAFWTRRAWRLLPSAWLWLLIPLLASAFFNRSGLFGTTGATYADAVAAILQVANFRLAEGWGHAPHTVLFPYWSLSLEEQFYLVLPCLVFLARRRLPLIMAALLAWQFLPVTSVTGMATRTGAIAAGVLLAHWSGSDSWAVCEPHGLAKSRVCRLALLGGGILLLGALGSDVIKIVSFREALIAVIAAGLVWVASYDRGYLSRGLFPRAPMLWLASRSYSLYLIHVPTYVATREIWVRLSPPGTVFGGTYTIRYSLTALTLLLVLSELNHRLVEQPLRRHGARVALRMAPSPSGQLHA